MHHSGVLYTLDPPCKNLSVVLDCEVSLTLGAMSDVQLAAKFGESHTFTRDS